MTQRVRCAVLFMLLFACLMPTTAPTMAAGLAQDAGPGSAVFLPAVYSSAGSASLAGEGNSTGLVLPPARPGRPRPGATATGQPTLAKTLPSSQPTQAASATPTSQPTAQPTAYRTTQPSVVLTAFPTAQPTVGLTAAPTMQVTFAPTPPTTGQTQEGKAWFAAPDGRPGGTGTPDNPWDIATAMGKTGTIKAGDTLFLRGGIYGDGADGVFYLKLNGSAARRITVRPYGAERAIINEQVQVTGQYLTVRDLEFTNTSPLRQAPTSERPMGLVVTGQGFQFINNMVYNTGNAGMNYKQRAAEDPGADGLIYGNIWFGNYIYDTTTKSYTWARGSAMYLQNETNHVTVEANISFKNGATGLKLYSETEGNIDHFTVIDNILFANADRNFLAGSSGRPFRDISLIDNAMWMWPHAAQESVQFGYQDVDQYDARILGNTIVGGRGESCALWIDRVRAVTVSGNTVAASGCLLDYESAAEEGEAAFLNNRYYGSIRPDADDGGAYSPDMPAENAVKVVPNRFEKGRANVAIYNWEGKAEQAVDLGGVLLPGQPYQIYDVQDIFGSPVSEGVYDGSPVAFPLALSGGDEQIIGSPRPADFGHTPAEFNAYLVVSR